MSLSYLVIDLERRSLTAQSGMNVSAQADMAFSSHSLHRFGQMV